MTPVNVQLQLTTGETKSGNTSKTAKEDIDPDVDINGPSQGLSQRWHSIVSFSVEGFSGEEADIRSGMNADIKCFQESAAPIIPGSPIAVNIESSIYNSTEDW